MGGAVPERTARTFAPRLSRSCSPHLPLPPLCSLAERTAYDGAFRHALAMGGGATALLALGAVAPDASFATQATVFTLSGLIGYQVVWGVTPALHAPLMSVTNAISGITVRAGGHAVDGTRRLCSLR